MLFHISISRIGAMCMCVVMYIYIYISWKQSKKKGGNNQYCVVLKSAESRACVNLVK